MWDLIDELLPETRKRSVAGVTRVTNTISNNDTNIFEDLSLIHLGRTESVTDVTDPKLLPMLHATQPVVYQEKIIQNNVVTLVTPVSQNSVQSFINEIEKQAEIYEYVGNLSHFESMAQAYEEQRNDWCERNSNDPNN